MNSTTFLDKIASTILSDSYIDLPNTIIVLPNKRAKIFLIECFKNHLANYTFTPQIISVEEFIQDIAAIRPLESIELLLELYNIYLQQTPKKIQQDFEKFSNWGKTTIQDFNEIDRYLLNPNQVFSYLQEIEVIKRWGLEIEDKTKMIDNYILFWKNLPIYYAEFYKHLKSKKIGYQGLLYREAVNNVEVYAKSSKKYYVFAGFNALNKAEEIIFKHFVKQNKAKIYWDVEETFLNDVSHDAGLFIRNFKKNWSIYKTLDFEWITNHYKEEKNIKIIGTSKSLGQAKIVSKIIKDYLTTNPDKPLDKVAIVLGDENLLLPVLYSLPENVGSLNITMGYSSKNNPIQLFISKLFKLHINAIKKNNSSYIFYYKDVLELLSNPIIKSLLNANQLIQKIKSSNYSYITHQKINDLQENKNLLFELIFEKWNRKPIEILELISEILLLIKTNLDNEIQEERILKTFLFSIYKVVNKLKNYCTNNEFVDSALALEIIYKQIIDLAEVSFEGEPLNGLQIMGVLESRVLDFETVIITSMNEGKFPAGKTNNSFIPYDIKKELGLPTYKEKDAVYTYHFYHLLQRAKNIYLIYNTENDGLDGGEKSRFITQLEVEKQPNHIITHEIIQPFVPNKTSNPFLIEKNETIERRLKEIATIKGFSPSALTSYIRNPIQFYFQKILSIRENEEVEEDIAVNTLGTIIHKTLEELYKKHLNIQLSTFDIDKMFEECEGLLYNCFKEIYKEGDIKKGKNLLAFEVAKRSINNFLIQEKKAIENGDLITILALEKNISTTIEDKELPYSIKISGNVDRIEIRNNKLRIIDYKTGNVTKNNLILKNWDNLTLSIKNDKIIQLLCYALMYEDSIENFELEVGIISFKNKKEGFMPFGFKEDKNTITTVTPKTISYFKKELIVLLKEILNPNIPFEEKI